MPTIYIAGDSLAANKSEQKKPESGWGEFLDSYIPANYRVSNHAINGRSSKSFIDEGRLDAITKEIKQGDLLLIQFGHNDQKKIDPSRYTDPDHLFQDNLKLFIETAKSHQAKPILLTPVTRRSFVDDRILDGETLGKYPDAIRWVSKATKTPLIDVFEITQALVSSLGFEGSKRLYLHLKPSEHPNYPDGAQDNTHLSIEGADLIASLIGLSLRKLI
ncbi:MAG: rhamnogalacturonan acetylesterase [Acholeplasmataceae bacterium]|jgi:lysophospholipase L1-like esterase